MARIRTALADNDIAALLPGEEEDHDAGALLLGRAYTRTLILSTTTSS